MNHLEIEYKTLLTKSEFDSLQAAFADTVPVTQTNYYIDTLDMAVKKQRSSLRIRTLDSHAELTLKKIADVGNMEYNQELSLDDANQIFKQFVLPDGHIKDLLVADRIDLKALRIWGHLTTTRREKMTNIGLMALDENHYQNQMDYELEVEVNDAEQGKRDFDAFLSQHHITFKYASSKVARAAAAQKTAI